MRTLEITAYVGCPNMCHYCPQEALLRSYKGKMDMTYNDFIIILKHTPKDVRIDFSGFSEIFCHEQGAKFIREAFDQGYQIVLYTTLVGFQSSDLEILKPVRFADLCFHAYPNYDKKWFDIKRKWFEDSIQQGRIAEITKSNIWSRAGNYFDMPKKYGPFHCLFADKKFDHNIVLPNGDVYICCQDYSLKQPIGNLYTNDFDSLDRGKITAMSNEQDNECICRYCELAQKE